VEFVARHEQRHALQIEELACDLAESGAADVDR
jgi:hypothetical protein